MPTVKSKILLIDTEQYSGNFEREMCAYVTGQSGECGVGQEMAEDAQETIVHIEWWNKHIQQESDDSGCARPNSIWETPGWFNNGTGQHYPEKPEFMIPAQEAAYQFLTSYHSNQLNDAQARINTQNFETNPNGWTQSACEATIKRINEQLSNHAATWKPCPSYQSVAIFVDEMPPKEVWTEFMERASHFCNNIEVIENEYSSYRFKKDPLTLTGFRQLEREYKIKKVKTVKVK